MRNVEKNMISKKFCVNGKAVVTGKVNKAEALVVTGAKQPKVIADKTYIMINGVPCNIKTRKPFVKIEK